MTKPYALLKGFEKTVETARPDPKKRQVIFDETTTGLALIISPKGKKTFTIVARNPHGKQVWKEVGQPGQITVAAARAKAAIGVARIKAGEADVFPEERPAAPAESFREVAERFIKRWVDKGGKKQDGVPLRSKREIERQLKVYVYPRWEAKPFTSIRRGAVTELLDQLVDNNGPVQADRVFATLSKLFRWFQQYDEDYVPPIIPEMRRSGSNADRARARILTDDEIRAVWNTEFGSFGAFLKIALLCGQRRGKVAAMRRDDIVDGVWTIPAEAREKVNAGTLKLPAMALEVITAQPEIVGNPYVFAGRGEAPMCPGDKLKKAFDAKLAKANGGKPIPHWTIHDLRRSARSLMARAGVRPDISERTLGHVIGGVAGVYDRHDYAEEKAQALEALAGLVQRILDGEAGNVVQFAKAGA